MPRVMSPIQLTITLILIVIYCALSWHFYLRLKHRALSQRHHRHEHAALGCLLLLHAGIVLMPFGAQSVALGVGQAIALVVWLMLLIYWTGSFFYRLEGLQLVLMPLAAVSLIFVACFPGERAGYALSNPVFSIHLLVSILAYSMFAINALIAVFMLLLDYALRQKRNLLLVRNLPSLLSLEQMMFKVAWVGFALLSLSLVSGVFFSEQLFGRAFAFTHKTVFGFVAWLIFGVLLLGQYRFGWRGRQAMSWSIAGFVALLFAYVGSKIILELILKR